MAEHRPSDFWTLLLFTGCLTVVERLVGTCVYRVKIPNEAIRDIFERKVRWFYSRANPTYARHGERLAEAFQSGDAGVVCKTLLPLLRRFVAVRGGADDGCGFLHTMLACAGEKADNLRSNKEGGAGFPDLVFNSEDQNVGVVIEVKCCDTQEAMLRAAEAEMAQIKARRYVEAFDSLRCERCYGFSVAFCKKLCVVKSEALAADAQL